MKPINKPIFFLIFIGLISNPGFRNRNHLNNAYDNSNNPACQYKAQKPSGLNKRINLISGVMNGIEIVIKAMQLTVNRIKSYVIEQKVFWIVGQDCGS